MVLPFPVAADHALGDGISMVSMMLRFVDEMPDADPTTPATPMPRKLKVGWWPRLKAIVWGTYIALVGPHLPADPPNQVGYTMCARDVLG